MKPTSKLPPNRLLFFDNLRTLMVLLVLVFHSGASYGTMVGFWPFHDANPTEVIDIIMILLDVFLMCILFFIAGFFALPSIQKKGGKAFLASKIKRLGVPWLVITSLLLPLLDYFHAATQAAQAGLAPRGYATHWLLSMQRIARFETGRLQMGTYLDMTAHFYQRYMWFLSLLLLFFILFWLAYEIGLIQLLLPKNQTTNLDAHASNRPVFRAFAWTGLVCILLFAGVKIFASSPANPLDMVWFSLGNLIQFQMGKLAFYLPLFGLGVYASARGWFVNGLDFGRPRSWGWLLLGLMVVNMLTARALTRTDAPSLGLQAAFILCYPLWTLAFLGWFTAYASRHWNRHTHITKTLAAHSYNMYLVHYAFVMTLPFFLSGWTAGPTLVKFLIVSGTTILLSYGVSRYALQPRPRFVVLGLVGLNILAALAT